MKDYFGYVGKTIVVTGGSNGMGKCAVEMLLDMGAKDITVMDFAPCDVKGVKFVQVDLSDRKSIDKAFGQLPKTIDKFFGFAGISAARADGEKILAVNMLSNVYMFDEYLINRMSKGGAIALVASTAMFGWLENLEEYRTMVEGDWDKAIRFHKANEHLYPHREYTISKRGVGYLVKKSCEKFFKEKEVRVNAICPGLTGTQLKDDFYAPFQGNMEMLSHIMFGPIARDAVVQEMAGAIIFINSDMASFITGEELIVDGGLHAMYEVKGMGKEQNILAAPSFTGPKVQVD